MISERDFHATFGRSSVLDDQQGGRQDVTEPKSNLHADYPDAFLKNWDGCAHQDCLAECTSAPMYCERLRIAFKAWSAAQKETNAP